MKKSLLLHELTTAGLTLEPVKPPERKGPLKGPKLSVAKKRATPLDTEQTAAALFATPSDADDTAAALMATPFEPEELDAQAYVVQIGEVQVPVMADLIPELRALQSTHVSIVQPARFKPQSVADIRQLFESEDQRYLNADLKVVNGAQEGLRVLAQNRLIELDEPASILPYTNQQSTSDRILLIVHGGHSNSRHVLEGFDPNLLAALSAQYRAILFFTHKTLTVSPEENATRLTKELAGILTPLDGQSGATTGLDLLCHSRGGLVARALLEMPTNESQGIIGRVRKVCFVASPNGGMNLFNPAKYSRAAGLFGLLSTVLEKTPGGLLKAAAEWLAVQAKILMTLAAYNLGGQSDTIVPGLACLAPESDFLKRLAKQGQKPKNVSYYAVGSNYEKRFNIVDEFVDRFVGADSDLVVETQSPAGYIEYANGAHAGRSLPIERLLVFGSDESATPWQTRYPGQVDHERDQSVYHSDYFRHPRFGQWITKHFVN